MIWPSFSKGANVSVVNVTINGVTINSGLSEEQMMTLKEALAAGKAEILEAISTETAQHAAKIEELIAQSQNGDLSVDELTEELKAVAVGIRGIVPDPIPSVEDTPAPTGPGE